MSLTDREAGSRRDTLNDMNRTQLLDRRRARATVQCPDCRVVRCAPLVVFGVIVPNRFLCECGRVVDRCGKRIKRRVVR